MAKLRHVRGVWRALWDVPGQEGGGSLCRIMNTVLWGIFVYGVFALHRANEALSGIVSELPGAEESGSKHMPLEAILWIKRCVAAVLFLALFLGILLGRLYYCIERSSKGSCRRPQSGPK